MRFKTVSLTVIRNGPKRTIFASNELRLFQMVLELDTGWCANEDAGPSRGVDCEIPYRLERGTKHIRVWKPLPSRRVLKP